MDWTSLHTVLDPQVLEYTQYGTLGLLPLMVGAAHGDNDDPRQKNKAWAWIVLLLVGLPGLAAFFGNVLGGDVLHKVANGNGGFTLESPLLLWIVLLPALGALFNGTVGQKMPRMPVNVVACASMGLSFWLSIEVVRALVATGVTDAANHTTYQAIEWTAYTWMESGNFSIPAKFVLDPLSALMVLVVTGVGFLIHFYSVTYMSRERGYARYFAYLNLFCAAMLVLVLGGNLLVTFAGWQGVGLCSYLLMSFWFIDEARASTGKKAFVVNRIGDFALILAMVTLFVALGTLDYASLADVATNPAGQTQLTAITTVVGMLTLVGCMAKSAQVPFHVWLPGTSASPTPVSALIHAVTTVVAGVYLLTRLHFLLALSPTTMQVMMGVGAATALLGATISLAQNEIKKVLAYSTVSQLGLIFVALGAGAYMAGVAHLVAHAFFAALLFLGAGSVTRSMNGEQDIRQMGGLRKLMPWTGITFLIGCAAIVGVPGLSGFFSREGILWGALSNLHVGAELPWFHNIVWVVGVLTTGLTALYMFRLYFMVFEGESRAEEEVQEKVQESHWSMIAPLAVLSVLSIFGGYFALDGWLGQLLASSSSLVKSRFGEDGGVELAVMGVSIVVALAGIGLAWFVYGKKHKIVVEEAAPVQEGESAPEGGDEAVSADEEEAVSESEDETAPASEEETAPKHQTIPEKVVAAAPWLHKAAFNQYYVDRLYEIAILKPFVLVGQGLHRFVDEFLIDLLLVNGSAWMVRAMGRITRRVQTGNVQRYAGYVLIGLGVIAYLMLFR